MKLKLLRNLGVLTLLLSSAYLVQIPTVGTPQITPTAIKYNDKELKCLAENIYHESKGEVFEGKLAVAAVTITRYESGKYGNSICNVVYSGSNRKTGCQFSWTCSNKKVRDVKAFKEAREIAYHALYTLKPKLVGNAEYFHATYVKPKWAKKMTLIAQIGNHKFYEKA